VVTRHFGLSSERPIKEVSVTLGEHRYRLHKEKRGPLQSMRANVVRGIVLKTEELPLDRWIDELAQSLSQAATESASIRAAFERFLL
jgi:hypothetical protein